MVTQRVVNVRFYGGIMALFNSPRKKLENVITTQNQEGYRTVFILPGRFSPVFMFVSMLLLIVTLLIWQPLPGYMVIVEKND